MEAGVWLEDRGGGRGKIAYLRVLTVFMLTNRTKQLHMLGKEHLMTMRSLYHIALPILNCT